MTHMHLLPQYTMTMSRHAQHSRRTSPKWNAALINKPVLFLLRHADCPLRKEDCGYASHQTLRVQRFVNIWSQQRGIYQSQDHQ